MSKFKAKTYYKQTKALVLIDIMNAVADGIASIPESNDAPQTPSFIRAKAKQLLNEHSAYIDGGNINKEKHDLIFMECAVLMRDIGRWANYRFTGKKIKLLKLKLPIYDAITTGKKKYVFILKNGKKSGEIMITVPFKKRHESFIVMYSFEAEALLSDCKLAGGSNKCKFSLFDLPVGSKIYVRWASIGAKGVSGFSAPYPIIVT